MEGGTRWETLIWQVVLRKATQFSRRHQTGDPNMEGGSRRETLIWQAALVLSSHAAEQQTSTASPSLYTWDPSRDLLDPSVLASPSSGARWEPSRDLLDPSVFASPSSGAFATFNAPYVEAGVFGPRPSLCERCSAPMMHQAAKEDALQVTLYGR